MLALAPAECKWETARAAGSAEIVHDYGRPSDAQRGSPRSVRLDGKTATSLEVPSAVVHTLGPSRRPPVRITVGGHDVPDDSRGVRQPVLRSAEP